MAECSQKFKDMLAGYKSDVHHECLLIDDFLADTDPILQYVAELEVERDGLRARLDSALADAAAAWRRRRQLRASHRQVSRLARRGQRAGQGRSTDPLRQDHDGCG